MATRHLAKPETPLYIFFHELAAKQFTTFQLRRRKKNEKKKFLKTKPEGNEETSLIALKYKKKFRSRYLIVKCKTFLPMKVSLRLPRS